MLGGGLCEATPPRILPVSLYRLTAADYSNGDSYHYTYDAVGNRLTQTNMVNSVSSTVNYGYDNANRLTSANGVTYTWDNNGNLLSDGVNGYTYNTANQLIAVSGQQLAVSYTYNGLGDRLRQVVNGNPTTFAMDLNSGLTQALSDGTNTYIYGNGRIAQVNTSAEYFFPDALGSVRQIANANAQITYTGAYDPYGMVTQASGASQTAYGFTNEYSSQGLVYLRARMYSPSMGRFLTKDTWGGGVNSPMSFNRWNYVHANPIMFIDPSGQIEINEADEAFEIVNDLEYNYQIKIKTDWGVFEQGTEKFVGLIPEPLAYYEANKYGCTGWVKGLWIIEDLRDCFLKTLWDTDATDFTELRGKNHKKKAPFRGFREIRVQKRWQQRLKKHSLRQLIPESCTTYRTTGYKVLGDSFGLKLYLGIRSEGGSGISILNHLGSGSSYIGTS